MFIIRAQSVCNIIVHVQCVCVIFICTYCTCTIHMFNLYMYNTYLYTLYMYICICIICVCTIYTRTYCTCTLCMFHMYMYNIHMYILYMYNLYVSYVYEKSPTEPVIYSCQGNNVIDKYISNDSSHFVPTCIIFSYILYCWKTCITESWNKVFCTLVWLLVEM